jgi:hypothetical protein
MFNKFLAFIPLKTLFTKVKKEKNPCQINLANPFTDTIMYPYNTYKSNGLYRLLRKLWQPFYQSRKRRNNRIPAARTDRGCHGCLHGRLLLQRNGTNLRRYKATLAKNIRK